MGEWLGQSFHQYNELMAYFSHYANRSLVVRYGKKVTHRTLVSKLNRNQLVLPIHAAKERDPKIGTSPPSRIRKRNWKERTYAFVKLAACRSLPFLAHTYSNLLRGLMVLLIALWVMWHNLERDCQNHAVCLEKSYITQRTLCSGTDIYSKFRVRRRIGLGIKG